MPTVWVLAIVLLSRLSLSNLAFLAGFAGESLAAPLAQQVRRAFTALVRCDISRSQSQLVAGILRNFVIVSRSARQALSIVVGMDKYGKIAKE